MKTFEEAMAELGEGPKPALLLANGFSQAWNAQIFNYATLYEKANFGESSDVLRGLFDHFETFDFERVMNHLLSAEAVAKAYGADEKVLKRITADQQVLKDALIATIGATHPSRPADVTDQQYTRARSFLQRFQEIFSLNYDLLLYWARNQDALPPHEFRSDDGFRAGLRWAPDDASQNVYFLHGGLHLYDTRFEIKKLGFKGSGDSIVDQVRDNLAKGSFPLFVAEPTADKKKSRIEHNPYLSYCFRALAELDSSLVVFGHGVHENDKHVFDQIQRSGVSKVLVSIFGDENSPANARTKANAKSFLAKKGRTIQFFDAASTSIW